MQDNFGGAQEIALEIRNLIGEIISFQSGLAIRNMVLKFEYISPFIILLKTSP